MIPYRWRPSFGFLYLTAVGLGTVIFLGWGLAQPPLDRVAELVSQLQTGHREALNPDERALLQKTLVQYPELAAALVEHRYAGIFSKNDRGRVDEKYAYLVRLSPQDPAHLVVEYAGTAADSQVRVVGWAGGETTQGEVAPGRQLSWTLPTVGPYPQLVELRFKGQKVKGNQPRSAVRIGWAP